MIFSTMKSAICGLGFGSVRLWLCVLNILRIFISIQYIHVDRYIYKAEQETKEGRDTRAMAWAPPI